MCPSSVLVVAKSPGSGQPAGRRRSRCGEEQGAGGSTPPAGDRETTCGCRRDVAVVNACRWSRSHPTRFVVEVDIFRRTSAHKRSPLFHRRAPEASTVVPEGSPGISHARCQETLRAGRRECRSTGRVSGRAGKHLQSSRRHEPQERDMPLQKAGTCLGRPAGRGAMPDNRWKMRLGQDVSGRRQEALGAVRRLRGAARLPPDDSIATVPLQSG